MPPREEEASSFKVIFQQKALTDFLKLLKATHEVICNLKLPKNGISLHDVNLYWTSINTFRGPPIIYGSDIQNKLPDV